MRASKNQFDDDVIKQSTEDATRRINEFLSTAEALKIDNQSRERHLQKLCRCCFYLRKIRVGGAAITYRECASCSKDMMFSSTATDELCDECAVKHRVCKRCSASMDA